jgi:cell division transport system permease protein
MLNGSSLYRLNFLLLAHEPRNFWHQRARNTYLTATLSMALVLFFLGVFMGLIFFGQGVAQRLRSQLEMKIFLHDGVGPLQQNDFELMLRNHPAVAGLRYVSKAEAAQLMLDRTGEDVPATLEGVNPLPASFNLRLQADYLHPDSVAALRQQIAQARIVADVVYQGERIQRMEDNLELIRWAAIGIGLLLVGVALYLILGTIRLSIYARRLTIRSMELVGATRAFILRPFLLLGIAQGSLAGACAAGLLVGMFALLRLWLSRAQLPTPSLPLPIGIGLLSGLVCLGLLLGWLGSYLAVNRYLNRPLDELM